MPESVEQITLEKTSRLTDHRIETMADCSRGRFIVRAFTAQEWNRTRKTGAKLFPDAYKFVVLQPDPLTFDVIFGLPRLSWFKMRLALPVLSKLMNTKVRLKTDDPK